MKNQSNLIVYGCYPSFFSTLIANILVVEKGLPISCIMVSTRKVVIEKNIVAGFGGFLFLKKRFGAKFLKFQLILMLIVPFIWKIRYLLSGKRFYSIKELCKIHQICYVESNNFNNELGTIGNVKVFISMCMDQILSEKTIKSITELCINVHPSDIPNFGGVEPIINTINMNNERIGISIHKMTKDIDKGEVIMRCYMEILNKSYFTIMIDFIREGTNMLNKLFLNKWQYQPIKQLTLKHPYKSWPSYEEIRNFEEKVPYLRINDLLTK